MSNFNPKFGVEIHLELNTALKAFSRSKVSFGDKRNTNINELDVGYPGAKPLVNKKIIEYGYILAKALNMKISEFISFDRKNYFYPDLPKGYQLTQFYNPIGRKGYLEIYLNGSTKKIGIREIHLEEDTAKQTKKSKGTIFDYNRSGIPLIEIVSGHDDFENIDEVLVYIKQLRELILNLGISDCKLEEGSLRVDINVSVSNNDSNGTRVEIKNLNSIKNISLALQKEIDNQISLIKNNIEIEQVTKRFDESTNDVITMRVKESSSQYFYFFEANILPIKLDDKLIRSFKKDYILSYDFRNKYNNIIDDKNIEYLLSNPDIVKLFLNLIDKEEPKLVLNFIKSSLQTILNSKNVTISKLKIDLEDYYLFIKLLKSNKITKKDIVILLEKSIESPIKNKLIEFENVEQLSSTEVEKIMENIIATNEKLKQMLLTKPESGKKFLMGQLMKETKGKINPKEINDLIKKRLN